MPDLHPVGPALSRRNRPLIAERLHWPPGALEECEAIDDEHPGWDTVWMGACAWNGRPAGFFSQRRFDYQACGWTYGATPDELRTAISLYPPPRW